jgi:hypothetical protein
MVGGSDVVVVEPDTEEDVDLAYDAIPDPDPKD